MGVDIQRRGNTAMPQPLLYNTGVDACLEQHGRMDMAKVVEPEVRHTG